MDKSILYPYYAGSVNTLDDKDYQKIYEDASDMEVSNLELLILAKMEA